MISVDGVEVTIEEQGYASITVRSEDGHLYRIPNRVLLENVVRKRVAHGYPLSVVGGESRRGARGRVHATTPGPVLQSRCTRNIVGGLLNRSVGMTVAGTYDTDKPNANG